MKKLLVSAVALCLLLAAPAAGAQPDQQNRDRQSHGDRGDQGSRGGDQGSRPGNNARPESRPAAKPAPAVNRPAANRPARPAVNNRPTHNRPAVQPTPSRPDFNRPGNNNRPGTNRPGTNRPGNNINRPGFNRPGDNNRPGVNRPGNNRPGARPDYSKYRRAVTAPRRFHAGHYRAPRGYSYQRWSYGQRLPSMYYANNFWLSNFLIYGLFAPPPDAVWVRYGPDALLVDRYTGEIISVEYNVFY